VGKQSSSAPALPATTRRRAGHDRSVIHGTPGTATALAGLPGTPICGETGTGSTRRTTKPGACVIHRYRGTSPFAVFVYGRSVVEDGRRSHRQDVPRRAALAFLGSGRGAASTTPGPGGPSNNRSGRVVQPVDDVLDDTVGVVGRATHASSAPERSGCSSRCVLLRRVPCRRRVAYPLTPLDMQDVCVFRQPIHIVSFCRTGCCSGITRRNHV